MNKKEKLSEYIKFRFDGYIIDRNAEVESSNTFSFEFRNLGDSIVTINGIELQPGTATRSIFRESLLSNERSYGNYTIKFEAIGIQTKKLLVIEKHPVLTDKENNLP